MMLSEKPRSPVSEHRKVTKSAMEKKRRARINSSLTELKAILAGIMSNKDERFDKMEKADILEMTVNYVRELQNKSSKKDKHFHKDGDNYSTGVNSCISEVIRYVTASDICDTDTKTKLLDHLANRVNNISTAAKATCVNSSTDKELAMPTNCLNAGDSIADVNNNVNHVDKTESDERLQPISICTNPFPVNSTPLNIRLSPNVIPVSPPAAPNAYIRTTDSQNIKQVSQTQMVVNSDIIKNKPQVFPIVNQAQPQVVSNIPLTIFVPANFCTNAPGTACVIPITLANPVPDVGTTSPSNLDSNTNTQSPAFENESVNSGCVGKMDMRQLGIGSDIGNKCIKTPKETTRTNSKDFQMEHQSVFTDSTKFEDTLANNTSLSQNKTVSPKLKSAFSPRHIISRKAPHEYIRDHSVWRPW